MKTRLLKLAVVTVETAPIARLLRLLTMLMVGPYTYITETIRLSTVEEEPSSRAFLGKGARIGAHLRT